MISEGLSRTGVAYSLGQLLRRISGGSEARLITLTMLTVGGLSGFMNAIGAAAVMLPAIVAAARAMDAPVSRVLLPLSYGALMGSMLSLVGTPANLLVNSVMVDRGFETFQLFDFTPVGAAILAAGIVTMVIGRRWLLPDHAGGAEIDSMLPADSRHHEPYQLEETVFEVEVPFTSNLVGQTVAERTWAVTTASTFSRSRAASACWPANWSRPLSNPTTICWSAARSPIWTA